jgi:hypothetical protein
MASPVLIGVAGHRLLAVHPRLVSTVDAALAAIEVRRPGPWALVSGFAEGADELVARRSLERGWQLHALLPLPVDDFATDMERPDEYRALLARAAVVEVVDPVLERPDCYRALSLALVQRCVELVAIWNGRTSRGTGGTGEVVAAARERGLTISWIEAADSRDGGSREPVAHLEEPA